ncbi:restriction endonuclease subunit S [Moraxella bovis]|uniref:restriction endonuclease subunit S n=1 Tax=Moraxella bovis TaxID=476 RepID=UPI000993FFBF|nr:restriction endonuclease subunit S [Moraxella bovis]OOR87502.1 restriction endonuclease subunit S [Moraxella bovis]
MKRNPMIEKLIQETGQNVTVEWKSLGEVAVIKTGQSISKQKILDNQGIYPVINSGKEPLGYIDEWNTENDPIGITSRGAGVGSIIWQEGKYFRGNLNYSATVKDKEILNTRFLYFILVNFQSKIHSLCTFTGIPALNASELKKLAIPIPPLSLQQKIVQILDAFTAVTAELTAEHTLRQKQKQKQYYRDLLLDFDNLNNPFAKGINVEWKSLGDITSKTQNIKWKDNLNSYQYIDLTSVDRENNQIIETIEINANSAPSRAQKVVQKNDVIFATTRPTQMRLTIIPDEFDKQIASTGYCVLRANEGEVLPEWIYFNLKTLGFQTYLENDQSGSAYPAISDKLLKEFQIPIPPLETQTQIVAILDKFDTLIHSISEGLPREIELRQKQYEYYRELLLDFA